MKLSNYPSGTTIYIEGKGKFEKKMNWARVDDPDEYITLEQANKIQKNTPARIKILAAPWGVVAELVFMLQEEYGNYDGEGNPITFDRVYGDAIERDKQSRKIRWEREKAERIANGEPAERFL